uniref:Uncharacterized protein n=1 Tax=Anguilla anguilla TaxID=7936 RepID=A0A0E9PFA2_ANGAN
MYFTCQISEVFQLLNATCVQYSECRTSNEVVND